MDLVALEQNVEFMITYLSVVVLMECLAIHLYNV